MTQVFLSGPGEDENIIQVDQNELANVMLENVVHHLLESCRRIGEVEAEDFLAAARAAGWGSAPAESSLGAILWEVSLTYKTRL